ATSTLHVNHRVWRRCNTSGCTPECRLAPRCGDGTRQADRGEQRDDGVNDGGYGECFPGCRIGARCGDGIVQTAQGETCDDGNKKNGDGCSATCRKERSN